MFVALTLSFTKLLLLSTLVSIGDAKSNQNLIFILVDGFSAYYFNQSITLDGFNQMARNGIKASYLKPDFPTLSLPNYYTMVTGLHVDSHGMTGNYMYDREKNLRFEIGVGEDDYIPLWWNVTTPIWIEAQNQTVETGSYWWVGCQIKLAQGQMKDCHPYVNSKTTEEVASKFDIVIRNLKSGTTQFELLYYEPVDHYGHAYGPESEPTNSVLYEIDAYLQILQMKIEKAGLWENTNVIVVSDHGQVKFNTSDPSRVYLVDDCISDWSAILLAVDRGSIQQIYVSEPSRVDEVYKNLSTCWPSHIKVYRREELPDRWHYKNGRFIPEIVLVADIGYVVYTKKEGKQFPSFLPGTTPPKGMHGYDNIYPEMQGIFFARGNCFKTNYKNSWMNMVDIYQIMTTILGIRGHAHNGTWSTVQGMLNPSCLGGNSGATTVFSQSITGSLIIAGSLIYAGGLTLLKQ